MKNQVCEQLESQEPGALTELLLWTNRLPLRTVATPENLHDLIMQGDLVMDILRFYFPNFQSGGETSAFGSESELQDLSAEEKWRRLNSDILPRTAMLEFQGWIVNEVVAGKKLSLIHI